MTAYRTASKPATISVDQAAKLLGIGRTLAYELARWQGALTPDIPVIKVGARRYRVPVKAVAEVLGVAEDDLLRRLEGTQ